VSDGYTVLEPGFDADPNHDFAVDVLVGLSEEPKRLSSRYFYDAAGSRLFAEITDQADYYPTAAEDEILRANRARICGAVADHPFDLVDLGAGDGRKTMTILEHLAGSGADFRYVPIDISESAVAGLVETTRTRFPGAPVAGLVSEYTRGIRWLGRGSGRRKLVLFLGSNIGNFSQAESRQFLRRLWNALAPGDCVLAGFDLKKDIDTLLRAYNDSAGKTRAFNLNLLARINRELGGRFDLARFDHYATFNVLNGAMESFLISLERQTVLIEALRREFHFRPFEPIHTEFSYKYLDDDIEGLAQITGFAVEGLFWDAERRFCDALWRVDKVAPGSGKA